MQYFLRNNQQNFDQLLIGNLDSVESSRYINGAPVLLLIHGWGGNYDHTFPWNLRGSKNGEMFMNRTKIKEKLVRKWKSFNFFYLEL